MIARVIPLILLAASFIEADAQIIRFFQDSRQPYVPSDIRIQSSGAIDSTTLVVWGSTIRDSTGVVRNVLVYQMVQGTTPVDSSRLLTSSSEYPSGYVRVVPYGSRFLVVWNDRRLQRAGTYLQSISLDGVRLDSSGLLLDTTVVNSVTLYGDRSSRFAALGWNDPITRTGRIHPIDTNGLPNGQSVRLPAPILASRTMPGTWRGTIVQAEDGSGVIVGSDHPPNERVIGSGILNSSWFVEPDSTVWIVGGSVRRIHRLWDATTIEALRFDGNPLFTSEFVSRISADTFGFHLLIDKDVLIWDDPNSEESTREFTTTLQTKVYTRSGAYVRTDFTVIGTGRYENEYYNGDFISNTRTVLESHLKIDCRGVRTRRYAWKWENHWDDLYNPTIKYDTLAFHLDPLSGTLVSGYPASCPTSPTERLWRWSTETVRLIVGNATVNLQHASATVPLEATYSWVGVTTIGDQAYLSYRPDSLPGSLHSLRTELITDIMAGTTKRFSEYSVSQLGPQGADYLTQLNFSTYGSRATILTFGGTLLFYGIESRRDHWEPYYSSDYSVFTSSLPTLKVLTDSGWKAPGDPLNAVLKIPDKYGETRYVQDLAWDPNRHGTGVLMHDRNEDRFLWIDRNGSIVSRSIVPHLPKGMTGARIIAYDGDTTLFLSGDTVYGSRKGKSVARFPMSDTLADSRYLMLFGDRFLRYGFASDTVLLLQTFDRLGEMMGEVRLPSIRRGETFVVSAAVGDSAIVVCEDFAPGIAVRFYDQDLAQVGEVDTILTNPPLGIGTTIVGETCLVVWIAKRGSVHDILGYVLDVPTRPSAQDDPEDSVETPIPAIPEVPIRSGEVVVPTLITPTTTTAAILPVPNPAKGTVSFHVRLTYPWPVRISLVDGLGSEALRYVWSQTSSGENRFVLDVGEIMPGVYTVVLSAGQCRAIGKLIVEN